MMVRLLSNPQLVVRIGVRSGKKVRVGASLLPEQILKAEAHNSTNRPFNCRSDPDIGFVRSRGRVLRRLPDGSMPDRQGTQLAPPILQRLT
jgi:hypothetical protein